MRYQFSSCKNKHAPSALKRAMDEYKENPALGMQCMHDWGEDVPPKTMQRLLSGDLPYVVEGNAVLFQEDDSEKKKGRKKAKAADQTETT